MSRTAESSSVTLLATAETGDTDCSSTGFACAETMVVQKHNEQPHHAAYRYRSRGHLHTKEMEVIKNSRLDADKGLTLALSAFALSFIFFFAFFVDFAATGCESASVASLNILPCLINPGDSPFAAEDRTVGKSRRNSFASIPSCLAVMRSFKVPAVAPDCERAT